MTYEEIKTPLELKEFMSKNINYGFVGKNGKTYTIENEEEFNKNWLKEYKLQDPKNILTSYIGTCWDTVELEREWFTQKGYNIKTFFIWFKVDKPNNLPTHTFLAYKENDNWNWFETGGIGEFTKLEFLLEYVKENHYKESNATLEDKQYLKIYEYSKPPYNIGVNEYIDHVTRKKIDF